MAVNRDLLNADREAAKSERGSGVNFVGKGTVKLRVLEFTDAEGNVRFARKVVKWGKQAGQKRKDVCVHRSATFGDDVPDAIEALNAAMSDQGQESPYTARKQYYVNAIDLNAKGNKKVERWALPTSVWEDISAVVCNDDWLDVLEPATGHAFTIVGTGEGFDREYKTTVDREAWPVPEHLVQQIIDPLDEVPDPGLHKQAELVGSTVEELYGDGVELQNVDPLTGEAAEPMQETAPVVPQASAGGLPARTPPTRGAAPVRTPPPAVSRGTGAAPTARPGVGASPSAPVATVAAGNKPGGSLIRGLARK